MLTIAQYDKIKNYYWVCTLPGKEASAYDWIFSPTKPDNIVNGLDWRNPTYEEAIKRQKAFNKNPARFELFIENRKRRNARFIVLK